MYTLVEAHNTEGSAGEYGVEAIYRHAEGYYYLYRYSTARNGAVTANSARRLATPPVLSGDDWPLLVAVPGAKGPVPDLGCPVYHDPVW